MDHKDQYQNPYQYQVGDSVAWRGAWGTASPRPAVIIDIGEKNGSPVYDLDNGHWAYEYQLTRLKDFRKEV